MELDKERDVLKRELEKTTATVSSSPALQSSPKKVGIGIRTYAADIADIMRREKGSVIKIALAEQARRKSYQETKNPTSAKNLIIALFGVIFIVAGILIFAYTLLNQDAEAPLSSPITVPGLMYAENQTQIDVSNLTRGNFFQSIHTTTAASFAEDDTITNMMIIGQGQGARSPVSAHIFFNKLGIKVPEPVTGTLTGEFMLGTYKYEHEGHLFLLLKVRDFNQSFSSMKEWEVSLVNDLVRLFQINPADFAGDIFLQPFKNSVAFNKESRNVYDENGALVMSYVYLDQKTILITNHMPSIEEIIKRINSQSIR